MERLTVAALIPFKHYVHLRRTGKARIVKYDNKKIILRSSLLPKPKEPLEVRYSRVRLRKKFGLTLEKRIGIIKSLFKSPSVKAYRLALRISKLRKRGRVRTILKEIRREIYRRISGRVSNRGGIVRRIARSILRIFGRIVRKGRPGRMKV